MGSPAMSPLPPLYLPVEIKVREFKSRLLIALIACARGYPVCLAQKGAIDILAAIKPDTSREEVEGMVEGWRRTLPGPQRLRAVPGVMSLGAG